MLAVLVIRRRSLTRNELDAPRPEGQWDIVPISSSEHDCVGNIFRVLSNKGSIRS